MCELSSIGSAISIVGILVFFVMLCHAFYYRKPVGLYDPIKELTGKSAGITDPERQAQIHSAFNKSQVTYIAYTEESIKNFRSEQRRTPNHPFVVFVF
ncbi:MAG TPA: hypothetical protein VNX01_10200 [Bacteroidia bacterium]|nr:hypothetical protein [Bacteroidia bacterium]